MPRRIITLIFIISYLACTNPNESRKKLYNPVNYQKVPDRIEFGKHDASKDLFVYKFDTTYKMVLFYWNNQQVLGRIFLKGDVKHGPFIAYFENGGIMTQKEYKNGKLNGPIIDLNEQGDTISVEEFKDGVKIK